MLPKRHYRRSKPRRATASEVKSALAQMRGRIEATENLDRSMKLLSAAKAAGSGFGSSGYIEHFVELAETIFRAGRVSFDEYVFYVSSPIEHFAEKQMFDPKQRRRFAEVENVLDKIRREHGLAADEFWSKGEGPIEFERANAEWEKLADEFVVEAYKQFAPSEILELRIDNPIEFEQSRERGRRLVHHADDLVGAVHDLIVTYEREAYACAVADAYYAATAMLGAAAEASLLLQCLTHPIAATNAFLSNPKRPRKNSGAPEKWTLAQLIEVCADANWLPPLEDDDVIHLVRGWAHHLRTSRNLLHPGRHVLSQPHVRVAASDFEAAKSAYITLTDALRRANAAARRGD